MAIQFRGGVAEGAVATTSVMEDPLRSIRIVGSYADGGCGAIGATASRTGNAIAFVVGPGTGECDLIRLIYEYDATLVGLEPGLYRVRVFHRPSAGPRELAIESTVTVH